MSHHDNAYFVDTQLITCHAIHSPYPCIPHHSYAHTPDTAHSPVAAPAEASEQQLSKHLSKHLPTLSPLLMCPESA